MHDDMQYQDNIIIEVTPAEDGSHTIRTDDGWSFSVPAGPIAPQIGMTARFYGGGIGSPVRGLVIDGHVFFYESEEQYWVRIEAELEEKRRADLAAFKAGRAAQRLEIARLPLPFQKRLHGFMRRRPNTAWAHQGYELATCQAAVAILKVCTDAEMVEAFQKADFADQIARVPALDALELSGNMFGKAVQLAYFAHTAPEYIPDSHATICPLVGCDAAGCWAVQVPSPTVDA